MFARIVAGMMVLTAGGGLAREALAWGATGHEWISGIAAEQLPDEIPAFVRKPEAIAAIAVMGRELDRSKGSGVAHDAELDPGHYVMLSDDGTVAGIALDTLPVTREDYDTMMRARNLTQYKVGYLPYSIVIGWQQLRKDFAYWRADVKGAETATDPALRAWFESDRKLREMLTLRDLGVWSHYPGDASQPMHVSVHIAGWGPFPNPHNYSTSRALHAYFEGAFVHDRLDRAAVARLVGPYKPCDCSIEARAQALIANSRTFVEPLYELDLQGAFTSATPAGIDFATARLAAGAQAARDMIVDAWRASADAMVGYPMISVRDIESGKVILTRDMLGAD
jgi:hypothetical protein